MVNHQGETTRCPFASGDDLAQAIEECVEVATVVIGKIEGMGEIVVQESLVGPPTGIECHRVLAVEMLGHGLRVVR